MSRKSQEKFNTAKTIEATLNRENIRSLLENLNIGTFDSINILKEIANTPINKSFDSNSEFSQCLPIGDLELETKWTEEGAIIRMEDTSDKKYLLGDIWDDRRGEIQDMFRGCCIELMIQAGATLKLIVRAFDKPIGDLAGMPWREKMHYAGLLWSKFIQFQGFIEKALQDLKKNSEEINNGKT
jgi:hypothetical protein